LEATRKKGLVPASNKRKMMQVRGGLRCIGKTSAAVVEKRKRVSKKEKTKRKLVPRPPQHCGHRTE